MTIRLIENPRIQEWLNLHANARDAVTHVGELLDRNTSDGVLQGRELQDIILSGLSSPNFQELIPLVSQVILEKQRAGELKVDIEAARILSTQSKHFQAKLGITEPETE